MRRHAAIRKHRNGMTLLELILALGIASIVMMAIAMAMQLQANTLDSRRNVVEEVQLARAVLRQISDDLRSAARYEELTISDTSQALSTDSSGGSASSAGSNGTGGASGAAGGTGGASSGASSGSASTSNQASSAINELDVENSTSTTEIPGIFGNQMQLQIDVSRLPRIDEYQPTLASVPGQMTRVPSGYRTIAYFLGSQTDPTTGVQSTGLIRRELDRTISDFAMKNGNVASINSQGELLAAEVTAIQFRYYDGQQYLLQWDTTTTTALPIAVEISLWLRPPVNGRAAQAKDQTNTLYRMVVPIPTGEYAVDASAISTTDSASQKSSSSNSGSGAASGGAAAGGGGGGGAGSTGGTSNGAGGS